MFPRKRLGVKQVLFRLLSVIGKNKRMNTGYEKAVEKEENMTESTKRAVIYCRVSTEDQAKEGVSLEAQESTLRKWVTHRGYSLNGVYVDDGYTGTNDKRPEFQALVRDAEAGKFDIVVVAKLDRLMRNTELLLKYVRIFTEQGIGFVPLDQPDLDTSTGNGEMVLTVLGMIARFESRRIGDRVRDVRQHLKTKGHLSAGKPLYGYAWDKEAKKFQINKEEAAIVMGVFDWYINQDMGVDRISHKLNEQGLFPRKRKNNKYGWSGAKISTMLKDKRYIGEDDHFKYPLIIEKPVFTKAQETLYLARRIRRSPGEHLLQGYVFYPICGRRAIISSNVFRCTGHNNAGCTMKSVREGWLQEQVVEALQTVMESPQMLRQAIQNRLYGLKEELNRLESIIEPQKRQIERVKSQMERIGDRYEVGELTKSEYTSKIQECKSTLQGLTSDTQEVDKAIQRRYQWQGEHLNTLQGMLDDITGKKAKIWGSFQLMSNEDIRQFMADFQIKVTPISETNIDIDGLIPVESIQVISSRARKPVRNTVHTEQRAVDTRHPPATYCRSITIHPEHALPA